MALRRSSKLSERVAAGRLQSLASDMMALEREHARAISIVADSQRASARNLMHYLALRRHDLRPLQRALMTRGLSSLGRSEAHVMPTVLATLGALRRSACIGEPAFDEIQAPFDIETGLQLLADHTRAIFGAPPPHRNAHIMVTTGTDAASDASLIPRLLRAGMTCMRINCAHDSPRVWRAMIRHLRRAQRQLKLPCTILMDLAGPKLRTGAIAPGPAVNKVKPERDAFGRVMRPGRVWLVGRSSSPKAKADGELELQVDPRWLQTVRDDDHLMFRDSRGRRRLIRVVEHDGVSVCGELRHTAYFTNGARLERVSKNSKKMTATTIGGVPASAGVIRLERNDLVTLTRHQTLGQAATMEGGRGRRPAHVSCSLPQVFGAVKAGERILLDDGRIAGVIERAGANEIRVRIQRTPGRGGRLKSEKGINFPDSVLPLPSLTRKDRQDLRFILRHADIVGLSFANDAADVRSLLRHLQRARRPPPAIMLKIETRRGFEQLPAMLLAAMRHERVAVMVARGDLAAEVGYERLAEVQEEILWICEAAHCPAIWATQVLESLAKNGQPSRAEITDAAMGNRAECVMLNKGPHIAEAVQVLANILTRMGAHQDKKSAMLRALHVADIRTRARP